MRTQAKDQPAPDPIERLPSEGNGEHAPNELTNALSPESNKTDKSKSSAASSATNTVNVPEEMRPRAPSRAGATEPFDKRERVEMEALLGEVRGHLGKLNSVRVLYLTDVRKVLYSTRFLEGEDAANNFLFNADRYSLMLNATRPLY